MYIPQNVKALIWLVLIAIALFGVYQIPAVRTLVNRTAATQGIDIDKNSPEAQIRRLKGSYDDREDGEIAKENLDRKVQQFREYEQRPCAHQRGQLFRPNRPTPPRQKQPSLIRLGAKHANTFSGCLNVCKLRQPEIHFRPHKPP